MKRLLAGAVLIVMTLGLLSACGVKSPPKYSPDAPKSEQKTD
ncbi:lipoprotein [Sneathiella chungangensis]